LAATRQQKYCDHGRSTALFKDVQYQAFPEGPVGVYQRLGAGDLDITQWFVAPFVEEVDRGAPIVFVAGVHAGCFERFGTEWVRAIRDLVGKTVGVPYRGPGPETFIATMLAHVGRDPRDVHFVVYPLDESIRLLAAGRIDAYLGFPPAPQELREKKIGSVVVLVLDLVQPVLRSRPRSCQSETSVVSIGRWVRSW
jgi:NitT/TauT family transport system substrate-binding protein